MDSRSRLVVVVVAAWLMAPPTTFAQSSLSAAAPDDQGASPVPARPDRRWSIAVDPLGGVIAGGAGDLEEAMRSAHFGDRSRVFGTVGHPYSTRGCQVVLVLRSCGESRLPAFEVDRRMKGPWSLAMLFSRTPVAATTGYQGGANQYLTLEDQVDSLGALLSTGGRRGQVGLGPALHVARVRTSGLPFGVESAWTTRRKLGFMARARATVPGRSRVFLDVRAEYHYTGRVPVGPYASIPIVEGTPVTFPPTSARFNYWFIGLGPGLRF
jgi:hypothetical protein